MKMTKPSFEEETRFWNRGVQFVIGMDEVGRGAFAGPIVAAGVVFSPKINTEILCDVNDSKLLLPSVRTKCVKTIKDSAMFWTVESVDVPFINKFGIGKANASVFRKVIKTLLGQIRSDSHMVLVDGFHQKYLPGGISKQKAIIKGDQKSISIAAASILAKVYRDDLMGKLGKRYKEYKFTAHKGYGTKQHQELIRKFGLCLIHRKSFNLQAYLTS